MGVKVDLLVIVNRQMGITEPGQVIEPLHAPTAVCRQQTIPS